MKHLTKLTALSAVMLGLAVPAFAQSAVSGPRITSIQLAAANSISLTLTGAVLTSYTIQSTTNLGKAFSTNAVVVTDATGKASFTDAGARALFPQRFYRAQQIP